MKLDLRCIPLRDATGLEQVTGNEPLHNSMDIPSYCLFDGLHWNSKRGLGRYAVQLSKHVQRMSWTNKLNDIPLWSSSVGRVLLHEVVEPFSREVLTPDIALYPHNVMPIFFMSHRSLRLLVVHDVIFLQDGEKGLGNLYRRLKLKQSVDRADIIFTVSDASRIEIEKLLVRDTTIRVVPNALAAHFEKIPENVRSVRTHPPRILHFGGHAQTKNTLALLQAVAMLNQYDYNIHLHLAAMSDKSELVKSWCQQSRLDSKSVTILPPMSDEELHHEYAQADLHCMPSTGEGFGIPVIEAARCGTPNVLSPLSVFRELLGEDAIYAESLNAHAIARAIQQGLATDLREMVSRARQRSESFLFDSVHRQYAAPALSAVERMAASHRKQRR